MYSKLLLTTFTASILISCDRTSKKEALEGDVSDASRAVPVSLHSSIDEQLALAPQYRDLLSLQDSYRKLAEKEPLTALKDLDGHSNIHSKTRSKIAAVICAEWASKDYQAAFAYLESIQGEQAKARTWQTMLFNASESHLQSLQDYYSEIPKGSLQDGAASLIARKIGQYDVNAAYQWASASVKQPKLSKIASELLQMALKEDLRLAISFLDSITTPEYRQPVVKQLGGILGDIDPAEGFAWFETLEASEDKEIAYPAVLAEYFKLQPVQAISLVEKLPEGGFKNEMMRKFAPALVDAHRTAGLEWLKKLDPNLGSTTLARQKFLGRFSVYDSELAMENAVAFAGDDQAYFKSILLEIAFYDPAAIAKLLPQYEGQPVHEKLVSQLIKGYSRKSSVEMQRWVFSIEDSEVRASVINESLPVLIESDPNLIGSFIEKMPTEERRLSFVNDFAQELRRLELESEFVANYLEFISELPSELQEALARLDSKSNSYPVPES